MGSSNHLHAFCYYIIALHPIEKSGFHHLYCSRGLGQSPMAPGVVELSNFSCKSGIGVPKFRATKLN
jgi:hypothetical protein